MDTGQTETGWAQFKYPSILQARANEKNAPRKSSELMRKMLQVRTNEKNATTSQYNHTNICRKSKLDWHDDIIIEIVLGIFFHLRAALKDKRYLAHSNCTLFFSFIQQTFIKWLQHALNWEYTNKQIRYCHYPQWSLESVYHNKCNTSLIDNACSFSEGLGRQECVPLAGICDVSIMCQKLLCHRPCLCPSGKINTQKTLF